MTVPRVIAAANAQVAPTIRSPITRCAVGCRLVTPCTVSVELPTPSILAPICCSIVHRSTISGSRAALSITVVPSASTAAMRMFSVAPTLGKSSQICAPCRSPASATTRPCSISVVAPSLRSPAWCMSSGREPIASPPGSGTTARRHRATSGPSTHTDARSFDTDR